jgi:hypothetical protein
MSRFQKIPRIGWIAIGIAVAVIAIPTAAVAAVSFTGIEGTSHNKADVSPAGQLLTSPADPSAAFNNLNQNVGGSIGASIGAPGSGLALVITSIHATNFGSTGQVSFGVSNNGCNTGANFEDIMVQSGTTTVLPYSPGVVVAAGDIACAFPDGGSYSITLSGYTIPAAAG